MNDGRDMLWKKHVTLNIVILFFVVGCGGWGRETMVSMALCERYSDLLTRSMICKMHIDEEMLYSTFCI